MVDFFFFIGTRSCLSYVVNTKAADDLAMEGARSSAAMALP